MGGKCKTPEALARRAESNRKAMKVRSPELKALY
jgi:hypothetical protein